jgi:cytochrome c oxidase subunit 4
MPDITETTDVGEEYDQPNAAVEHGIEHEEYEFDHEAEGHPGDHWTDLKFVYLAIALAVITAIEVALSYMVDDLGPVFLPALLLLMFIKFFSVVFYFMHLKFDNRLFSLMFYMGLGLAVTVYLITLFTFKFFNA